jgi:hypothetical protein
MRLVARILEGRRRAEQPQDEIDIVAGLCEEGAVAIGCGASPVSSDVAVGEVPPADGFGVFEGDDVADDAVGEEEFAQECIVRAIAEDMADGEDCCWWARALVCGFGLWLESSIDG